MSSKKQQLYYHWRTGHKGKWQFATRRAAWRVVPRLWWRNRHIDLALRPYRCTFGRRSHNINARPHYHLGHTRLRRTTRRWWRVWLVWPYYRTRRRLRSIARFLRRRLPRLVRRRAKHRRVSRLLLSRRQPATRLARQRIQRRLRPRVSPADDPLSLDLRHDPAESTSRVRLRQVLHDSS